MLIPALFPQVVALFSIEFSNFALAIEVRDFA